ncbi:DUF3775 domain-containing protein [Maritimibacter sp. UBA3975]|uniref:DUF3775 domain-containing protein n=1 Tax=Maritimibacter sp. UBA3975 TaxID=1946833 RepID=UPI000C0A5F6C|nr:DUF3775 domain-containing protein [Maritimibacter sp. UBA3975]MAM63627.1 hypothetical protein [Maritimibacter sp.]|tara:strand:- start:21348 stop:21668 length:321 start_codon:yes stop_codon:yes gene_type:complete
MLEISPSRIARIAIQARERPQTDEIIRGYIEDLNTDEQASLVAVMWIGRETFEADDLEEAIATAKAEATAPTGDYLLGETLLADYLEAGLDALGYSVEDLEDDHLK